MIQLITLPKSAFFSMEIEGTCQTVWCRRHLSDHVEQPPVRLRCGITTCQTHYVVSEPPVRKAAWCLNHLSGYVMSQLPVGIRGFSTTCQKGYVVSQPPVRKLHDVSTTCRITWFLNPVRKSTRCLNHLSDTLRCVSTICQVT